MAGFRLLPGTEEVVYRGRRYRRHPGHEDWHRSNYFMATTAPRTYLHRDIYQDNGGTIPAGWHVHHADHNTDNNEPANLVAVDPVTHARHHGRALPELDRECRGCGRVFGARRPFACWCSTSCKERWRRGNGLVKRNRKGPWQEQRSCEECGAEFTASRPWARFCKSACKQRAGRRAVATGAQA